MAGSVLPVNKYMRAKKFNKYCGYESRVAERKSKKEFRQYCTIILILLLCTVFYAICIHFDLLGVRDWDAEDIQSQSQDQAAPRQVEPEPAAYIEHRVSVNETLWGVAERYHPTKDNRKVIWAIRGFNRDKNGDRMSANIIPGQVVRVPMDIDAVEEGIKEVKEAMEAEEQDQREEVELASRHDDSSRDYGK